jgi:hypothetical protein
LPDHLGVDALAQLQHQCVDAGPRQLHRRQRLVRRGLLVLAGELGNERGELGHGRTMHCAGLTDVNRLSPELCNCGNSMS